MEGSSPCFHTDTCCYGQPMKHVCYSQKWFSLCQDLVIIIIILDFFVSPVTRPINAFTEDEHCKNTKRDPTGGVELRQVGSCGE